MPNLFIYPKKEEAFTFPLEGKKISIGRSADNEISIFDPYSSGHHAYIYPKENNYVLRDNNSKNGSFLNGNKIQSETLLNRGDEILIGSTRIVFDQELSTNVEVTDTPSSSASINSMIQIEDLVQHHDDDCGGTPLGYRQDAPGARNIRHHQRSRQSPRSP